uniref:Lithium-sensitive myo-inositol monophosphatase A1 n=1 Tax=Rhinopithecus roxellana TaxID=61622 RepID=A0A2K6QTA4_RHIRO
MADPWQECMDYAVTLRQSKGPSRKKRNEMKVIPKDSPVDLVTAMDQKVEEMLLSSIKEKYPSHGEKSALTNNPTWIIDPIDGTTNFVHRFPFVAVSIGFAVNIKI